MTDSNAFELQVADEIERLVGAARPIDDLAVFKSVAAATKSPQWRFPSMFAALKFTAAGLVLALFGGTLYFGLLQSPDGEVPPPAATMPATEEPTGAPTVDAIEETVETERVAAPDRIALPDQLPKKVKGIHTVDSGAFRTPIGRARWIRLYGADANLPDDFWSLTRVPGGYAVTEEPNQLWFSKDLLHWERLPLPAPAARISLHHSGDDVWLKTIENDGNKPWSEVLATRLWRSADLIDWTEIDLSSLGPPEPQSADWQIGLGPVASNDGLAIVPVDYRIGDMSAALGLEEMFDHRLASPYLKKGEDGAYVVEDGWGTPMTTVRFEDTPDGLLVTDATTGAELDVATDLDLDFIDRWATPSQATVRRLAAIDGADARYTSMPEVTPTPDVDPWDPTIGVWNVDGQITAFFRHPDGDLHTWATDDGESWQPRAVIGDEAGEPKEIDGLPDRRVDGSWVVGGTREDGRWRAWESTDLSSWQRLRSQWARLGDHYVKVQGNELVIEALDGKEVLSRSIERKRPRLPEKTAGESNCGGGSSGGAHLAPGVLAHVLTTDCRYTDIWIVQFDRFAE